MATAQDALPMLLGQKGKGTEIGKLANSENFVDQMRLFYSCSAGDPVNTKNLLESTDVNYKDYNGRTALHSVCGCTSAGAKETTRLLLKKKADVNVVDNAGMTPMDIAVKVQNFSIQRILEENGVELQSSLEQKGKENTWLLKASEFVLKKELANTLKSVVHLAEWHGTTVVVKSVKMEQRSMLNHVSKSASFDADSAYYDSSLGGVDDGFQQESDDEDADIKRACAEELLSEIELVSSFRHPDLVLFLGACLDPGAPVMFVTEYMPKGDVEKYMFNQREAKQVAWYTPPLSRMVSWCCAVARALAFLHKFPVLHRDLKPMNLLLTQTLDVKVSDFGTGRLIQKVDGNVMEMKSALTMGTVGTFNYTAPEMMRSPNYDEKVDIYAFALIMYYLASGRQPFMHIHPQDLVELYAAGEEPRPDVNECHRSMRGLIESCWAIKAAERPSAEEILKVLHDMDGQGSCEACSMM